MYHHIMLRTQCAIYFSFEIFVSIQTYKLHSWIFLSHHLLVGMDGETLKVVYDALKTMVLHCALACNVFVFFSSDKLL